MSYIQEFNFPIDRHTIRATDDILTQLRKVADDDGRLIFEGGCERVRSTKQSMYNPNTPYAILKTGEQSAEFTGEGTIFKKKVEVIISLVFSISPNDSDGTDVDYQAYADGLAERTWDYLQPYLADNLHGMVPVYPEVWRYDFEARFKNKLDRRVVTLTPELTGLTGSLYAVPIQFGIIVFPATILT